MVFLALVFSGCGSTRQVMAPDGRPAYLIKCRDSANCFKRAQKVCPKGYRVMDQERNEGYVIQHGGPVTTVSPEIHRQSLIRCRDRFADEDED